MGARRGAYARLGSAPREPQREEEPPQRTEHPLHGVELAGDSEVPRKAHATTAAPRKIQTEETRAATGDEVVRRLPATSATTATSAEMRAPSGANLCDAGQAMVTPQRRGRGQEIHGPLSPMEEARHGQPKRGRSGCSRAGPRRVSSRATSSPSFFQKAGIEEMAGPNVHQRGERAGAKPGVVFLEPFAQHAADDLALQVLLRAAEIARMDGKLHGRGEGRDVALRRSRRAGG